METVEIKKALDERLIDVLRGEIEHKHHYHIVFNNPVNLPINKRKSKSFKEATVLLFFVERDGDEFLAFSFHTRTGYYFNHYMKETNILSIEKVTKEDKIVSRVEKARLMLKKIHKNSWDDLRVRTPEDFAEHFLDSNLKPVYFLDKIDDWHRKYVEEGLKKAFEDKTKFNYHQMEKSPTGRHFTIETRLCDDGIFRAWFSSEYAGCGNGDYYLIINPKVAMFGERD